MYLVDQTNPPKPCAVFDIIAGTSTGGLIAIMLGRLVSIVGSFVVRSLTYHVQEMDVETAINAYCELSKTAFAPRKRNVIAGSVVAKIFGSATFDHKSLEGAIKSVIKKALDGQHPADQLENAPLLQDHPTCKMYAE
jgi:hypothetical protein